jgi:ribosomal protein S18 acetylase RimI-like enzyme
VRGVVPCAVHEVRRRACAARGSVGRGTVALRMGLSLRDGAPADYPTFARLFPALEVPDPLLTAAQFEERMLPNLVIAVDDDVPVGYAHWRLYGTTAHVVHVVVEESARGHGVGRALLEGVRGRVVTAACRRWYLNVKATNTPAIRLYERAGMTVEQRGWSLRAAWADLVALPGTATASPLEPSPEQQEDLAREHGMDAERLAQVRARPGVVFVALQEASKPVAFAAFDPAFPGIYPIAVGRSEHARVLFDALHPHANGPQVNIFVEGNAALAKVLRDGGATLSFEILRMGAALG